MNLYELINEIGSSRPDSQGHLFTLHNADRVEKPDGHYSNQLTIIKDRVFPSFHDAVDWIEQRASKEFYHDYAVLFRDIPKDATSAIMKRLTERYNTMSA